MNISIDSYRSAIGVWHSVCFVHDSNAAKVNGYLTLIQIKLLLAFILTSNGVFIGALLLLRCGDVHPNPGPPILVPAPNHVPQNSINKSLSICHINIQSLYLTERGNQRRKINEIEATIINSMHMDIVCLSETWLKPSILDEDVDIAGYQFKRKDRVTSRYGGVGMYINDFIFNRRALEFELPDLEVMWVEIHVGQKTILLASGYRPPRQTVEEAELFLSRFRESLDMVLRRNPESILFFGDLNDVCTEWDSDHNLSELGLQLYDYVNANDLHQMIREPTFYTDHSANILDILITDSPGYLNKIILLPPLGSGHEIIRADFKIQYTRDKAYEREIWDYRKGDFEGLLIELEHAPWRVGYVLFDEIDDIVNYWQTLFMDQCKSKIPNRVIKIRPKDKPWITHEVLTSIRRRNRAYKKFKRTQSVNDQIIWKHLAREANYYMHKAKLAHTDKIKQLLMDTKVGEKKYWKIAKEVYGNKKQIGIPALIVDNKQVTTSSDKATCFSKYFAEQQTLPPLPFNHQLPPLIFMTDSRMDSVETSEEEVLKIINTLEVGKAHGPDGISNRLLKETAKTISKPLASLFNKSFELGKVPKVWKEANVTPIFKKEDKSLVSNYRPISLLSSLGKIQERVVYIHLYRYLKTNDLLNRRNSGFKELDSAMNQLLLITDKIHKALEQGQEICLVFLDVSKAFDRVWHSGLLHKARCMGIGGILFDWLCDYLQDRRIRAVINGQKSEWFNTTAGVPQGSILGPLLFLIFINDITENIESDIHLFADDTSLMEILENYNLSYAKLNRDLNRLSVWSDRWLITFNAAKTVYLKITRKINPSPKPILKLKGVLIKEVFTHKHLGVTFNTTLTWGDHINKLVTKAAQCVGLLRRICRDVPRQCLEILYKAMIRPLLEYGAILYDGSPDSQVKRLEDVQRQAALACTGAFRHTKHTNLLEELGWPLLSIRRKHQRMNVMFKIQNGLVPPYLTSVCPPLTRDRTSYNLRSGMNITTPQMRTTTYQNSFFPQTIRDWNGLDGSFREVGTIDTFKDKLKRSLGLRTNHLYHQYPSKAAVNHTRIRLGLSGLSSQRFDYKHIDSPRCLLCGAPREDPVHYFLLCPNHRGPRDSFLTDTGQILNNNGIEIEFGKATFRKLFIEIILKGTTLLSDAKNMEIFEITQKYIKESQRFH